MAGLKFRVLLDSENNSEIFRDILINDTDNFDSLYKAVLAAFDFSGDQMASFYVSNDNWDKGHEISLMDLAYDEQDPDAPAAVMKDAIIKRFLEEPDQKFILVHDFMRMWIFLLELIGYEKEGPEIPAVLMAVGTAPREDSRSAEGEDMLFAGEFNEFGEDENDEEDEFGFNDYEDGMSDDDFAGFDDYDY